MKSAHSFTLSKLARLLSTAEASFLYFASLASKLVAAAFPVLRLCSGVVLPLDVGVCSSAYAVSTVADAEDDARFLPGIMSFASRPWEAGLRRPLVGDVGRDEGDDTVDCGEVAEMVGIASDILFHGLDGSAVYILALSAALIRKRWTGMSMNRRCTVGYR